MMADDRTRIGQGEMDLTVEAWACQERMENGFWKSWDPRRCEAGYRPFQVRQPGRSPVGPGMMLSCGGSAYGWSP